MISSRRGAGRPRPEMILIVFFAVLSSCVAGPDPKRPAPAGRRAAVVDVAALHKEIIAKLAGAEDVQPGRRLSNRAAPENKAAARAYLVDLWRRLGLDVETRDYSAEGQNIYSVLPAEAPSAEFILVGAHYDTAGNSPGANDNASGVALVTAAAAEMRRVPARARHLMFILFDEEERGLRGSRAFARKLQEENRTVHSVHTIDQIGWDRDGDRAVELEIPYDGALDLYLGAARAQSVPIPVQTTSEAGSDHSAFRRLGFRAVGLTEEYRGGDTTPHIHRPTDTFETIDFEYLGSSTKLVVAVLRSLVRR